MATTMDATLLKELFIQRLPVSVRMVLTPSAEALNLDQLAQLADNSGDILHAYNCCNY